jgi:hypothetical protein
MIKSQERLVKRLGDRSDRAEAVVESAAKNLNHGVTDDVNIRSKITEWVGSFTNAQRLKNYILMRALCHKIADDTQDRAQSQKAAQ